MKKDLYIGRRFFYIGLILFVGFSFLVRLFQIQVVDDRYKELATNNVIKIKEVFPVRGLVYDRYGNLIVGNEPVYDLKIISNDLGTGFDTAHFCKLLGLNSSDFSEKMNTVSELNDKYRSWGNPEMFFSQVPLEDYSRYNEFAYKFNCITNERRTIRSYPYQSAALVLGDVGIVSELELEAFAGYQRNDYIGKSGLESEYEAELKGERGFRKVLVDAMNREQGSFLNGADDIQAIQGTDLKTTLDIELQNYGEWLMKNKKGAVVAIEPATGEILAMVSSPSFDPNLLSGRDRGNNYAQLKQLETDYGFAPLFNRAINGQYPPGSTFKAVIALVALQEEVITENFYYPCNGGFYIPGRFLKCSHAHASPQNVQEAIKHSCNPYFWQTFKLSLDATGQESMQEAYQLWFDHMASFGMGKPLNIDLPGEKSGNLPTKDYYNELYGQTGWKSPTIISLGIGQGEMEMTPLQLANLYACIANRGFYVEPHIVKAEYKPNGEIVSREYPKYTTSVDSEHFDPVVEGLQIVVESGTGRRAQVPGVSVCGKTGTVENPHGEDHSMFAAFAPADNPKIAIAVVVENAGFGSRFAAPIAGLMIEHYLNDTISSGKLDMAQDISETNLLFLDFIDEEGEEEEQEIPEVPAILIGNE